MKINQRVCEFRQNYASPDILSTEVSIEHGFATSIEVVGKDEETDF